MCQALGFPGADVSDASAKEVPGVGSVWWKVQGDGPIPGSVGSKLNLQPCEVKRGNLGVTELGMVTGQGYRYVQDAPD